MKIDLKIDLKSLLTLEQTYGKKLVTVVYYVMAIVIAVNVVVTFIGGIVDVASTNIFTGLGKILFCLPLGAVYLLLLRLGCELVNAIFEHCGKE